MAKETITRLIDDITGEPIEDGQGESVTFAVQGVEYSIDLNEKNAKKFHETMKFYTDHGTRVGGRARRSTGTGAKTDKEQLQAMREWLRAEGHDVSDRGRIAQHLQDLYNQAH